MSGQLCQEFRQLNFLNDIIKNNYGGHISRLYFGPLWNAMRYKHKSDLKLEKETKYWHDALKWKNTEIFFRNTEIDKTCNMTTHNKFHCDINIRSNKILITQMKN